MIEIDYRWAMHDEEDSSSGSSSEKWPSYLKQASKAVSEVLSMVEVGKLGFWRLPKEEGTANKITEYVRSIPFNAQDVLVLAIGGSSLGSQTIEQALATPCGTKSPRFHFTDNVDPWKLSCFLKEFDPSKTLVLVVSKSGGTIETVAQYFVVRDWLEKKLGKNATEHLVFVTDPEKGFLRKIAQADGIACFDIAPNVGGRFSVLSPVGLLPAALMGMNPGELLLGAAEMADFCERKDATQNPAALLAALHVYHHRELSRDVHVMMPYADALRYFSAWWVQLWAESLGKRYDLKGQQVEVGPTPVCAVGATDQHSQVQLFMEGPRNKLITFIQVQSHVDDLTIPQVDGEFSYLSGTKLSEVLEAERKGTTLALAQDARASITLVLENVDARNLGGLFFLFEATTAFAGQLYGIDAFDQPGVELGKKIAKGILRDPQADTGVEKIVASAMKEEAESRFKLVL